MIAGFLAGEDEADDRLTAFCTVLQPSTAAWWASTIEKWRLEVPDLQEPSLPQGAEDESLAKRWESHWLRVGDRIRDRLRRRMAEAGEKEEDVAKDSPRAVKVQRASAVGALRSGRSDKPTAMTILRNDAKEVAEWVPPVMEVQRTASVVVPRRESPYEPTLQGQVTQRDKVRSWNIRRLLRGHDEDFDIFFTIGALEAVMLEWGEEGAPPLSVLRKAIKGGAIPVLATQFSGHIWSVRDEAPLDAGQCAAYAGVPWRMEEAMVDMVASNVVSESQMRQLTGQATNKGLVCLAMDRMWERTAERGRRWIREEAYRTVGIAGEGINCTGYQALEWMGGGGKVVWAEEGEEVALRASRAMDEHMDQAPRRSAILGSHELASPQMHATVDIITAACAPFTTRGAGLEAALNDLGAVLQAAVQRKPKWIIYENSLGAWGKEEVRARMEMMFTDCKAYAWESMRMSPDTNTGDEIRRRRVVYMGIRSEVGWLRGMEASAEAGTPTKIITTAPAPALVQVVEGLEEEARLRARAEAIMQEELEWIKEGSRAVTRNVMGGAPRSEEDELLTRPTNADLANSGRTGERRLSQRQAVPVAGCGKTCRCVDREELRVSIEEIEAGLPRKVRATTRSPRKRAASEDVSMKQQTLELQMLTGREKVTWVMPLTTPAMATVKWSASAARAEVEKVRELTGLPEWLIAGDASCGTIATKLDVYLTMARENGEWVPHGVVAESGVAVGQLGYYMAYHYRRRGANHVVGWLRGAKLGEAESGSEELAQLLASAEGDYCFERVVGRRTEVLDGKSAAAGGVKRVNDAHGVAGVTNNATLEPDGTLSIFAQTWVPPLDGKAASWTELRASEVLWDYGEAYWRAQEAKKQREVEAERIQRRAGKRPRAE